MVVSDGFQAPGNYTEGADCNVKGPLTSQHGPLSHEVLMNAIFPGKRHQNRLTEIKCLVVKTVSRKSLLHKTGFQGIPQPGRTTEPHARPDLVPPRKNTGCCTPSRSPSPGSKHMQPDPDTLGIALQLVQRHGITPVRHTVAKIHIGPLSPPRVASASSHAMNGVTPTPPATQT